MMKSFLKAILKASAAIAILLGISHLMLSIMDFKSFKEDFAQVALEQYGLEAKITGQATLKIFPLPRICFKQVVLLKQGLQVADIQDINFSYVGSDLFNGNVLSAPKNIFVRGLQIDLGALPHVSTADIKNYLFNFSSFTEITATEVSFKDRAFIPALQQFSLKIEKNSSTKNTAYNYLLKAVYASGSHKYRFIGQLENLDEQGNSEEASLKLYPNEQSNISIKGVLKGLFTNCPEFKGRLLAEISNLQPVAAVDTIAHKFNISANLSLINYLCEIKEITLNIDNMHNLVGSVEADFGSPKLETMVDLSTNFLDIDALTGSPEPAPLNSYREIFELLNSWPNHDFSLTPLKELTAFINLKVDKMKIFSGEVTDFIFSSDIVDSNIYLNSLAFNMPGEGSFNLYGATMHNAVRPKFMGKVWLSIADFKKWSEWANVNVSQSSTSTLHSIVLQSDLSVIPHRAKFSKLKAAFNDLFILGHLSMVHDGNKNISLSSTLQLNKLNTAALGLDKFFDEAMLALYRSDHDKSGIEYFKLVKDYNWLRYLGFNLNLDVVSDTLVFKDIPFQQFALSLEATPGLFSASNFHARSNLAELEGNFTFSLPAFRPHITGAIHFPHLDTQFFTSILPNSGERQEIKAGSAHAAPSPINLYSIQNFDGMVDISVDNLVHDNFIVKSLSSTSVLDNGIVTIKNLKGRVYGGELAAIGSIVSIEPIPQFIVGFALNNITPTPLLKQVTGLNKLKGYMSLSGSLSTTGQDPEMLLKRLNGTINISGKSLTWEGFSMDEIIKIPDIRTPLSDQLNRLSYYTKYGASFLSNLQGKIEIINGLATLSNIEFDNNRLKGVLVARYDIANRLINALAKFSFIPIGSNLPIVLQVSNKGKLPTSEASIDTDKLVDFLKRKAAKSNSTQHPENSIASSLRNLRKTN